MKSLVDRANFAPLALPQTPVARRFVEFVTQNSSAALANHGIRE